MKAATILITGLLLGSPLTFANEQTDAIRECQKVMEKYSQELKAEGKSLDMSDMCQIAVKPATYWQCTDKRMADGEKFLFATSQCGGSQ